MARQYLIETDIDTKRDILGDMCRALKGLTFKMCNKFSGYAEFDDLSQECFFGILRALETWSPDKRKFLSHVTDHLTWHLYRYVQQSSDGRGVLREYHLYKNYEEGYFCKYGKYPSVEKIALNFRVTPDRVNEIRKKARYVKNRLSWEDSVPGTDIKYSETVPDKAPSVEDTVLRECVCEEIRSAVLRLPTEERVIITKRYFRTDREKMTPEERIIQRKALKRLCADKRLKDLAREESLITKAYSWKNRETSHTEWSAILLSKL